MTPEQPAAGTKQTGMDWAARQRPDARSVTLENLQDLRARGIIGWADLTRLWDDHTKKVADYGDVLVSLALLEVEVKAGGVR